MCRQVMFSLLVVALGLTSVAQGAKIIWVADNLRYNFDTNEPADIGFVQLLRDQGHEVDYKGEYMPHEPGNDEAPLNPQWQYWRELDPNKIAELEAADLIIVARDCASSTYDDTGEAETWNAISTPLIMQGPHLARRLSKWGWFDSGSTSNKTPRLMTVTAPDHAIFAGVELDPNSAVALVDPNTKVTLIKDPNIGAGNGRVLGLHDEGLTWIAEWDAGVEFYDGSGAFAGGPRMWFGSAAGTSDEALGIKEGQYNLTAAGETIFLNAVNYMLTKGITIIWVADNLRYNFDTNEPADIGFVNLLRGQGYTVDYKGEYMPHEPGNDEAPLNPEWQYWRELDPNKLAELEAADLIIIARDCASSTYDDTGEAEMWNSISTPIMMQGPHLARRLGKWGWFDSGSTTDKAPGPMTVLVPDHDIFAGITIDANDQVIAVDQEPRMNFIKDLVGAGNGTVLAEHGEGYTWIAEWRTGVEFYDGSTTFAGGPRMWFGSAAGNKNEGIGVLEGSCNLSADGEVMFLNAVAYLIAGAPLVQNGSFERPGTEKQQNWENVPAWASDSPAADSGVEGPDAWPGNTDGVWAGFLMGTDPSAYNLTDYVIQAGDVLTLFVDARDNWTADAALPALLEMSLYYDVEGQRMTVATETVELTLEWATYMVTLIADDAPDAVGHLLGVEINNVSNATSGDNSWIGVDYVQVIK